MNKNTASKFKAYYKSNIYKDALSCEKLRKKAIIVINTVPLIIALIVFFLLMLLFSSGGLNVLEISKINNGRYDILIALICLIFGSSIWGIVARGFFITYFKKKYNKKVQQTITTKVLKFVNLEAKDAAKERYYVWNLADSLKLLPHFTSLDCDNYIVGEYKGIKLKIYDLLLERRNSGQKQSITVFRGALVSFDNPNQQTTTIIINSNKSSSTGDVYSNEQYNDELEELQRKFLEKSANEPLKAAIELLKPENINEMRDAISKRIKEAPKDTLLCTLNKVNLEDPVFEKLYNVYSDDQIKARNFLTPALMNKIVNYVQTKKRELYFSYERDLINLKFNSKIDLFDVSFDKKPLNISNYTQVIDYIEKIFEDIDFILSLNN